MAKRGKEKISAQQRNQQHSAAVAQELIERLKEGTAPWQKPWEAGHIRQAPFNPTTGRAYRGGNSLWLEMNQPNDDPRWMTYRQAQDAGAQVRKGEKGTLIEHWRFTREVTKTDEDGKPVRDEDGQLVKEQERLEFPQVSHFTVFHASQIEGLAEWLPEKMDERGEFERHDEAERLLSESGADIRHGAGDRAYYAPQIDQIHLPQPEQFNSPDAYYATALHELGHWTGHESRLNRDLVNRFGTEDYAREELRAEISSMMVGRELGIGHDPDQHAAYVGSWIKVLEEDPREIFRAARDAERIKDFVLQPEQQREIATTEQQRQRRVATSQEQPQEARGEDTQAEGRTYFAVPYRERHAAKERGARWDRQEKAWYAPAGLDLGPFDERWTRFDVPDAERSSEGEQKGRSWEDERERAREHGEVVEDLASVPGAG